MNDMKRYLIHVTTNWCGMDQDYPAIAKDEAVCKECNSMQDALNLNPTKIGGFCADAGLVSVFLLDEVMAYNPNISTWIEEHPWCVTVVKDFDGDVEYYVDEAGDAHIVGVGSTNFFTTQTGL